MLYYLFEYLERAYQFPGASLFAYLSFRSAVAIIFSLLVTAVLGKRIIAVLQHYQMGESIRDLGLEGQKEKAGTPTMGGLMIIFGTLIPVLLLTKLDNIYIILLIVTTLWMGAIGLADDYLKIKRKDKEGLKGRFKIVGQITLGLIVGATLYFHPGVTIKQQSIDGKSFLQEEKSTKTTIPLLKNNEFDYSDVIAWAGEGAKDYAWLIFIPAVIFIVTAVSNGANLTDGIDGLAAGTASIAVLTLGLFAWVSGNIIFADYLNVMYIPEVSEVVVFVAAFVGALVGFLWYNAYPAQVFMGDTGSLTIGGVIAVLALIVRKELLIPVLCGVFLIENLSVILQVSYFKYTKKRQGVGKRIFKMAPLHHHYQKLGYHESKIVSRFWIIAIMLAIISLVTLKIR
ncbi:MAG: phospho-N-acetylmuramoyl-pentapeptide-transferase [Flavobacteriaceae bacterium]|jgi:phospho-N-acetylmuramoyl-pentapeptide-transferase|nr:phospho-N-acetylmuramoyl-pentapeptide-transferase [Flavobacteriaceae bacterium]MDG2290015.1 phospho-N-acetylmuramoyl-pentapeptide-transferase [Flavobacteriaceae bacterium]